MREFPSFSGNFDSESGPNTYVCAPFHSRRLTEECASVSTADLRRILWREALLAAVRDARPVVVELAGGWHSLYFSAESHWLSGRRSRWSDIEQGNARLWLV